MEFVSKDRKIEIMHSAFEENSILEQFPEIEVLKEIYPEIAHEAVKYLYLLDNVPCGIFVADPDGTIKWMNTNAQRLFGYSKKELVGLNVDILKSGHQDDDFYLRAEESISKKGYWHGRVRSLNRQDEQIHLWLHLFRLFDQDLKVSEYVLMADEINNSDNYTVDTDLIIDRLTQLGTKEKLHKDLEDAIKHKPDKRHYLVMMNVEKFSDINIRFGFASGDILLKDIGLRLLKAASGMGNSYRIANDTFAVLMENIEDDTRFAKLAKGIDNSISMPFWIRDKEVFISTNVGISIYPNDGNNYDKLIQKAEVALQFVKKTDLKRIQYSSKALNEEMLYLITLEEELTKAIEDKSLHLKCQTLFDKSSKNVVGAEALVRWSHPDLGIISPAKFIPFAESTGLIVPLGYLIIEEVFKDAQQYYETHDNHHYFFVNISANQFEDANFLETIERLMTQYEIKENQLIFEFTERVASRNQAYLVSVFEKLRNMGIMVALDDFGTGESSLSFLTKFKVDIVKIDASFVTGIWEDDYKKRMLKAIINFCKEIGVVTIVEGIETIDQVEFLNTVNCDFLQGYYFSRPRVFGELYKD